MHISEKKNSEWMKYIPAILIVEIVIVALVFCFKNGISGNDFWWHIKVGEWIMENGNVPTVDIFSWYGIQQKIPWTAHEWLADVIYFLIYQYLGSAGIFGFALLAAGLLIFLMWWQAKDYCKNNPLISGLFFTLLAVLCSLFFYGRPHVFSYFLLFFELKILYEFLENPASKKIYFIPVIGCLWSNLHGGSSNLAYILCIVFLVCSKLNFTLGRIYAAKVENKAFLKLLGVSAGTVLSILVNPIGFKVLIYLYISLGNDLMMKVISEWQPPDAKVIGNVVLYFLPIILMSIGFFTEHTKIRFIDIIVMGMFIYLFFRSARFIILWYIAAVFYSFRYMPVCKVADIVKWWEKAVAIVCGIALIGMIIYGTGEIIRNFQIKSMISEVLSDEMISCVKEDSPERIFNDYNTGESLIYNEIPVFFDARADLYEKEHIFENGLSLMMLEQANKEAGTQYVDVETLMDYYNFDRILMLKTRPLYSYMMSHPDIYECIFEDNTAGYFKRIS